MNNKKIKKTQETLLKEALDAGTEPLTKEQKKQFMEAIAKYNEFGKSIYHSGNIMEVAKAINEIAGMTESIALSEGDEWFDKITVQRNVKSIKERAKLFMKTCSEASKMQQRLESLYEEIGTTLNRYFHINEIQVPSNNPENV